MSTAKTHHHNIEGKESSAFRRHSDLERLTRLEMKTELLEEELEVLRELVEKFVKSQELVTRNLRAIRWVLTGSLCTYLILQTGSGKILLTLLGAWLGIPVPAS